MRLKLLCALLSLAASAVLAGEPSELEKELLAANGSLTIADTVGNDPVVYRAMLGWAAANKNIEIKLEQTTLLDVTEKTGGKTYDLVIYQYDPSSKYELQPEGESSDYAIEAALVFVNAACPLDDIQVGDLNAVFCGDLADWLKLTAKPYSLHRYGVVHPAAGERAFRRRAMGQVGYTDSMMSVATTPEVVAGVSGSEYGIGFGGFPVMLPQEVKALKVNGISPSPEHLRDHTYPLMLVRAAAVRPGGSPLAGLFVRLLRSPEVGLLASAENLFPAAEEEMKQDEKKR
ncbi:MAG: hypothetical protein AB7F40_08060 [Victivallaceae bacterium]|nr:hypothetical protein [Victivallaceae bacterium]